MIRKIFGSQKITLNYMLLLIFSQKRECPLLSTKDFLSVRVSKFIRIIVSLSNFFF